jgi:uncharacterized protein Yka (UPF0111/DUF47 family)
VNNYINKNLINQFNEYFKKVEELQKYLNNIAEYEVNTKEIYNHISNELTNFFTLHLSTYIYH